MTPGYAHVNLTGVKLKILSAAEIEVSGESLSRCSEKCRFFSAKDGGSPSCLKFERGLVRSRVGEGFERLFECIQATACHHSLEACLSRGAG